MALEPCFPSCCGLFEPVSVRTLPFPAPFTDFPSLALPFVAPDVISQNASRNTERSITFFRQQCPRPVLDIWIMNNDVNGKFARFWQPIAKLSYFLYTLGSMVHSLGKTKGDVRVRWGRLAFFVYRSFFFRFRLRLRLQTLIKRLRCPACHLIAAAGTIHISARTHADKMKHQL